MTGFAGTLKRMRELAKCAHCGKATMVFNAGQGRSGFTAERVTLETHCACIGGPAHRLLATTDAEGQR